MFYNKLIKNIFSSFKFAKTTKVVKNSIIFFRVNFFKSFTFHFKMKMQNRVLGRPLIFKKGSSNNYIYSFKLLSFDFFITFSFLQNFAWNTEGTVNIHIET